MQWRRRTLSAKQARPEEAAPVFYQLSDLARAIREMARDDSDYHRAHESAARERQKELLDAIKDAREQRSA